jgi:hypothetical protein
MSFDATRKGWASHHISQLEQQFSAVEECELALTPATQKLTSYTLRYQEGCDKDIGVKHNTH